MVLYKRDPRNDTLTENYLRLGLVEALSKLDPRKKAMAIPPDFTRFHSYAKEAV